MTAVGDRGRTSLGAVLTLLHRDGAASRADLTQATGLNRSTIALIVADLVARGLAVESGALAHGRVGRPSPQVSAAPDAAVLAVNPELDALTVGVVGFGARVLERHRLPARLDAAEAVAAVADLARGRRLLGIGAAVPGLVGPGGTVRWAPHLGWRDVPFAAMLAEATGLPAVAANDAHSAARAEHLFGAGQGHDDLVFLNGGSSGIGGAVIAGGRLLTGTRGFTGEFGHNRVDGLELEQAVGRDRLLAVVGLGPETDEATLGLALASSADPAVTAEIAAQQAVLAQGIANAVNVLDPGVVVLGGFLAALLDDGLRSSVRGLALAQEPEPTRLAAAALAEDRILIGAAEAALAAVLTDPAAV